MKKPLIKVQTPKVEHLKAGNSRRKFLKIGGLAVAGSSLLLYSCSDDDDMPVAPPVPPPEVFDLGTGDVGILNYAYALEQLEAAFYQNVVDGGYFASAPDNEKQIMQDLRNHEYIHKAFFKKAISAAVEPELVLPDLEFDFSTVDFSNRDSVLGTAQILEDTGVAAYNGAGKLISNATYLLIAGKIVSVEARHAAAIRDLIAPGTANFAADEILVDLLETGQAYDKAVLPADIIAAVGATGFITTEFTANELPTS